MEAKKTPKADLRKKRGLFLNIGLLISTGLALAAFEFKSYTLITVQDYNLKPDPFEGILDVPITPHQVPKPPKIEHPEIKEVPNDKDIQEKFEPILDIAIPEDPVVNSPALPTGPPLADTADEVKDFAEQMPTPPGGMEGWAQYLSGNLTYPKQAVRMGIEGTVFLVFVVNKDGSIQDVEILRGVGGGCSEEAIRVLENAPDWKPGLQGGRPVRVKMRLPIKFKLN
ncbi:energy transducer TonB [Echinicola vietnamensis]|uniref:TonB family protein n=1 Tax=Echinicola vietnamensis (strain DSM 17526 / LMG 23754 / KMM 6221) TaxID=926556 RepID=L0G240_ECHVK|nr:energy transducer TonB [Echinicola vietnamensis]AGA80294.1 TonB family protein [Echinicola vietnamensis DSM 17526]